jgi:two-component system CheB/CheR fusion protein
MVNLTVQRLSEPKELRGTVMVVISDSHDGVEATRPARRSAPTARSEQLERELQRAHEEIQTTREEMQTSQEELKSTNEELQSTNEELQSTNEELTTSKEEMQSMNEELQTVNHELQSKVDELSRSNNDMKNLLNSTDIATLFLDGDLRVRRFTSPTAYIIKLIPSDIGRPISDIARDIDYPELMDDAREVIRSLVFKERLVAATKDRWFAVRIMPYRTLENVIDGVVITFTDASDRKAMEGELRQQASEFRQMAESLPNLVLGCRLDGSCDYVSPQWLGYTGATAAELLGHGWLHAVHDDEREDVRQKWRAAIKAGSTLDLEFRLRGRDGKYRWFKSRTVPIRDVHGKLVKWYATSSEVNDLKEAAEQRRHAAEGAMAVLQNIAEPFFALTDKQSVSYANRAAQRLIGKKGGDLVGQSLVQLLPESDSAAFRDGYQRVVRERREISFDAKLRQGAFEGRVVVRMFPSVDGVGVLLQPKSEFVAAESPDGNSGRGEGSEKARKP